MHRFYCPNARLAKSTRIQIKDSKEIHHLKDVLRLKNQDQIIVFDGKGGMAVGRIEFLQKNNIDVLIEELTTPQKTKISRIVLACAVPKKAKFETIIEKCTELDVDEIIPLKTQRTILKLKNVEMEKKISRYQSIAVSAAKQSGRSTIPQIHPICTLKDALKMLDQDSIGLIPFLGGERQDLKSVLQKNKNPQKIVIFIGPEGDFTKEEVDSALNVGCFPITLGDTVLKVDTAAMAVVAFVRLFLHHDQP